MTRIALGGLLAVIFMQTTAAVPVPKTCGPGDAQCLMGNLFDHIRTGSNGDVFQMTQQLVETENEQKMDFKCFACLETMEMARILFRRGEKNAAIEHFLTYICKKLKIETDFICQGLISAFRPEVFYVFEHLALNPREMCGFLLNDCGHWYNPFHTWNITLPNVPKPPVVEPKLPPTGAPVMRILHLSDIHFDLDYKPGSYVECNELSCCHAESTPKTHKPAGYWGSYGACDIPYWTLENMLDHITQNDKFDIVYWTGDLPPHYPWSQTRQTQLDIYKNLTSLFLKYFNNTPIYSALGNHESAPVNNFPPDFIRGNLSINWLYDALEKSWTNWVPKSSTSRDIKYGGYYTTVVKPGLRLISVNTNYCNKDDYWLLLNATDPNHELNWLAETLQKAEDHGEKVHIIGHIPPGYPDCLKWWSFNYYKIINRYENTVAGQFYGHTHNDHYQVFYDVSDEESIDTEKFRNSAAYDISNKKRPTGVLFIAPSVTTSKYLNPGYRIYNVDGSHTKSTHMVLDHETYITNITDFNAQNGGKLVWKLEYTARKAFGLQSLFPKELDKLVTKLENDDKLWGKFLNYYYKELPMPCDSKCKTEMLCALRSGRSHDSTFC